MFLLNCYNLRSLGLYGPAEHKKDNHATNDVFKMYPRCVTYIGINYAIYHNRSVNGGLFMCFLDAFKAFDRVKHSVPFDKLVQRGVPGYIVRYRLLSVSLKVYDRVVFFHHICLMFMLMT